MSGPPPRAPTAPVSARLLLPCCPAPERLKPLTSGGRGMRARRRCFVRLLEPARAVPGRGAAGAAGGPVQLSLVRIILREDV